MAIKGYNGSVTVAGNASAMGNAKAWSLDISQETADTTKTTCTIRFDLPSSLP